MADARDLLAALDELRSAAGHIHAGGLQPDLDRFERAMIGAGIASRAAFLAQPDGEALDVERLARALELVHAEIDQDTNSQKWRDGGHEALEMLERELPLPHRAAAYRAAQTGEGE